VPAPGTYTQKEGCLPVAATVDVKDREITRLKRRLRDVQALLRDANTELARRPALAVDVAEEPLSAAEIRHLHEQFAPPTGNACTTCGVIHRGACETCGGLHARACPRIRSVEYQPQGDNILIRKVEYWPDGRWSTDGIYFPEQLPPLADEPA
jgi:hypothetical protein